MDRQSTLFDLEEYRQNDPVQWGWLEPEPEKLGGSKNLPPNSESNQLGGSKNLPPNSDESEILPPNSSVRGQNDKLPPNLQIVKVKGTNYFLTPTTPVKLLPIESTWYEVKTQKGNKYLYLRWRSESKKKSRCLGRIDALKYSD